jgi:hypothetical protein
LQPTDWNAEHVFKVEAKSLVGNSTSSEAAAEAIHLSDDFEFEDGDLSLTTSLNDVDIVVATIDAANPDSARVLTNTSSISWDVSVDEQVKAKVVDDSIGLAHMAHSAVGGELLYYSKTGTPIGAPTRLAIGDLGTVLTSVSAVPSWEYSGAPHCVLIEQQSNGQNAHDNAAFTAAGWRDRVINTQILDTFHFVTFASNIFTLDIGTWVVEWSVPASRCEFHQTRLYNNTATAHPFYMGTSEFAPNTSNGQSRSTGVAQVAHTVATGYKIQHYCDVTGTFGKSTGATGGTEVYTVVKIWRVA